MSDEFERPPFTPDEAAKLLAGYHADADIGRALRGLVACVGALRERDERIAALTAERDASVAAMRDVAEVVGVSYMGAVGLAGAVRMERDTAFARGAEAMREAAARACYDRASALDEGVSDDEAETDEEGYGRFQEALALEAMIRALKVSP